VRYDLCGGFLVRCELAVLDVLADFLFEPRTHQVVLVKIQYMDGVGDRQIAVAIDDQEVLVVAIGRLVAEVVTAGDNGAVLFVEGIDYDYLVVDYGVSRRQQFRPDLPSRAQARKSACF
jgi:hypothetical protein